MFCRFCGAKIADDSLFCAQCGKALKAVNINDYTSIKSEEDRLLKDVAESKSDSSLQDDSPEQVEKYKKRVALFLEGSEWDKATEYCEKILDYDPECAYAYECKLLAALKLTHRDMLQYVNDSFENNILFQRAVQYASDEDKQDLISLKDKADDNLFKKKLQSLARKIEQTNQPNELLAYAKECDQLIVNTNSSNSNSAKEVQKECIYKAGMALLGKNDEKAKELLSSIDEYKDSEKWINAITTYKYNQSIQSGPGNILSLILVILAGFTMAMAAGDPLLDLVTGVASYMTVSLTNTLCFCEAFGSLLSLFLIILAFRGCHWAAIDPSKKDLVEENQGFFRSLRWLGVGFILYPIMNMNFVYLYYRVCDKYPHDIANFWQYLSTKIGFRSLADIVPGLEIVLSSAKISSVVCIITGVLLIVSSILLGSLLRYYSLGKRISFIVMQVIIIIIWSTLGGYMIVKNVTLGYINAFTIITNVCQMILLSIILITFRIPSKIQSN